MTRRAAKARVGVDLVVFVGPTLPHAAARAEVLEAAPGLRVRLSGPARQGDVWRALRLRPRVIALIDGVFEASPSVWHHELLDALDAGVLLFGAASMGALRAAELQPQGMIGVGRIFARYSGGLDDDAAVALLHAGPEHGWRPLTVPLVNAGHALAAAAQASVLTPAELRRALAAARGLHYQARTWEALLAGARLPAPALARWRRFAAAGLPDLKADDARLCLREAARAAAAQRSGAVRPPARPRARPPSALVRHRRVIDQAEPREPLDVRDPRLAEAAREGLRTLLVAGLARAAGLVPTAAERAEAEASLLGAIGPGAREALLLEQGLAEDELQRAVETLALERLALVHAARLLPDGPSLLEGLRLRTLLGRR